ncbi:hypothetical protein [Nocardiopsis ganjiahuensis]|uniref:hypothetical protein n=1 Tax=Nocardiopsis ganjiahuensis TaxID=239984 RepID=UPI00034644ED|nr:hypothetical protein [Nocardiopsis ganjiahuensis]
MVNSVPSSPAQRLSTVEEVVGSPFPSRHLPGGHLSGSPDHHLVVLAMSRDFWEDGSVEAVEAAEEEIRGAGDELTTALDNRWGAHGILDPRPWYEAAALRNEAVAEPFASLQDAFRELRVWQLSGSERWFGLTSVQHDRELEIMLVGVVGRGPVPAPPRSGPVPARQLSPDGWSALPGGLLGG